MRISHNPPRSRHKLAQWESERARLERNGLIVKDFKANAVSRSTSLRSMAFTESKIRHSEFNSKTKPIRRPVQRKVDIARNRAALAFAHMGEIELFCAVTRS